MNRSCTMSIAMPPSVPSPIIHWNGLLICVSGRPSTSGAFVARGRGFQPVEVRRMMPRRSRGFALLFVDRRVVAEEQPDFGAAAPYPPILRSFAAETRGR